MNQWPLIWEQLKLLIYTAPATLLAIAAHEFAHGLASYWLGDPTPKRDGRLSLNPLRHLDLLGTVCMLIFHFGWAKPVLVNPQYYKKPNQGMALAALAGPGMNLILAFLSAGIFVGIFYLISPKSAWQMSHGWKPKRTEPPARMLKINRVLGGVFIVIGILCFFFL